MVNDHLDPCREWGTGSGQANPLHCVDHEERQLFGPRYCFYWMWPTSAPLK